MMEVHETQVGEESKAPAKETASQAPAQEKASQAPESEPQTETKAVNLASAKSCVANGIWCKCGFQNVHWSYDRIEEGSKDCYTLTGTCQICGMAERVTAVGFDYKYEKKKQ